jgi:hypothetical protein
MRPFLDAPGARHRWRRWAARLLLLGAFLAANLGLGSSASAAANLITDCAHAYGPGTIGAAVAAGGSWTFSCGDTGQAYFVSFGPGDGPLHVTKPVSIDSGPYAVALEQGLPERLFNVTAGSLTLRKGTGCCFSLVGGQAYGRPAQDGAPGVDGGSGANGTSTSPDAGSGSPGTAATPAPPVGPSSNGDGGCIFVGPGTTVRLSGISVSYCSATGDPGGNGAPGGRGGDGGRGWDGAYGASQGSNGTGANGADGSAGATGGEGLGGAIYNAGTLVVAGGTFAHNIAQGGNGGSGGMGGPGGQGGGMHDVYDYGGYAGADGGTGGDGARAGDGGAARGGAIYNAGHLSVSGVAFSSNTVKGGHAGASGTALAAAGGSGGPGGGGEPGYPESCPGDAIHPGGPGGNGGNGGKGGSGGNGGDASGAAIFSSTETLAVDATQFGTGSQADVAKAGGTDPNGPGQAGGGGGPGVSPPRSDCHGNPIDNPSGSAGADGVPGSPGHAGHAVVGDVARPVRLSGSVRAIRCGESTCSRSGMAGVSVLVTGRSDGGPQVTQVDTTDAHGSWSVLVSPGKYHVGPTYDGKTIDAGAFDPGDTEVLASSDRSGIDFAACAGPSAGGQARDVRASVAATALATPDACRSIYTVAVSARIPTIVDPSPKANYRLEGGNGYHHPASNPWFSVNREFPACFSMEKVRTYTAEHDRAEWFTYIKGGELSSVKVSFAWDRHTQEVHVVSAPHITLATLTRVFVFRLYIHGHVQKGTCEQKVHEPLLVLPVGGADTAHGELPATDFSLIVAWAFPFDPAGVRIDPSTFSARAVGGVVNAWHFILSLTSTYDRFVEGIVEELGKLTGAEKLAEKLWPPARVTGRLAIEFGASELLGLGTLKAIAKAPAVVKRLVDTERYLPSLIRAIEKGAHLGHTVGHVLHGYNTKREVVESLIKEIVEVTASFSPEGGYPVMGAVIRGRFATTAHHDYGAGNRLPDDSTLALSARTTELPSIKLAVTRSALRSPNPKRTVTNGPLPWHSSSSATLNVFNLLGEHQSNLLTDPFVPHHERGLKAVEEIEHATSQLPELAEAVRRSEEEVTQFTAEDREAERPGCSSIGEPEHGSFLCYVFRDARP